ncbi:hypothetical protein [Sulfitobacter mediterraneus]|uniref:Uncharacterized protein n=1 Tax=Sulfitobacter mediterraneus TaxID=83219 RepID=A0A2T6CDA2_9RHOB|nr:hypothetical protein [Sulfitobacter mediterraneus]KIN79521.1 hypothetical protein Z950_52 [Sulfitobacter mediterraneus KCTC 32188]PTX73488.1 hypothetical protein C8N31_107191 [Sulfitobacter mediterraneus]
MADKQANAPAPNTVQVFGRAGQIFTSLTRVDTTGIKAIWRNESDGAAPPQLERPA